MYNKKEEVISIEEEKEDVHIDLNLNIIDHFNDDSNTQEEQTRSKTQIIASKLWELIMKGKTHKIQEKNVRAVVEICDGSFIDSDEDSEKGKKSVLNCWGLLGKKNFDNLFGMLSAERRVSKCFGLKKESKKKKKDEKLGWVSGVFVPIILDCFGVILFFRIPMAVGNVGIIPTIILFSLGYLVCILTVSSVSAIVTNGVIEAGGPYFMISRIMGKIIGGSVGIVLFMGNIFGTALNIIGFIDAAENSFPYLEHFLGLNEYTSRVVIGSLLLVACVVVNILGAKTFEKATIPIFIVLILSILTVLFSFFFLEIPIFSYVHDYIHEKGYTGFRINTILGNLFPKIADSNSPYTYKGYNCSVDYNKTFCDVRVSKEDVGLFEMGEDPETGGKLDFASIFGILFPACTGILVGTNLSGDLKDPGKAIPKGSILGIIFTFIFYMILIVAIGMTTSSSHLMYDYDIEIEVSFFPWVVRIGIFCATVSSALTSLFGSSRILNSISMDNIFPFLGLFSYESIAIIGSAVLVEGCIFLGKMNLIAPFVTLFFILTFAIINLSTFMLSFLKPPNFRPTFQYYSKYSCLAGALICIIIMLVVNWVYSLVSFILVCVISVIIYFYTRKQKNKWGSLSLALQTYFSNLFQERIKYSDETHVKYWRFTGLFLVSNPRSQFDSMNFFGNLSKRKGGLLTFGHVLTGKFRDRIEELDDIKNAYTNLIEKNKWESFFDITFSQNFNEGVESLLITSGIGKFTPKNVILGYYDLKPQFEKLGMNGKEKLEELNGFSPIRLPHEKRIVDLDRFMDAIKACLVMNKSLIIHKNFMNISENILKPRNLLAKLIKLKVFSIDVWLMIGSLLDLANPSIQLSLQLGHLINNGESNWKNFHKLRIFFVTQGDNMDNGMAEDEKKQLKIRIENSLEYLRISGEVKIIEITSSDIPEKMKDKVGKMNENVTEDLKQTEEDVESDTEISMIRTSKTENVNLGRSHSFFKNLKRTESLEFDGHTIEYNNVYPVLYRDDLSKLRTKETMKVLNNLITKHSKEANCVITPMPPIPQNFSKENHKKFYKEMKSLSNLSVPLLLVHSREDVISVTI